MQVQIQKEVRGHQRELVLLKRLTQTLLQKLSQYRVPGAAALIRAEVSVLLTNDRSIQKINLKWRNKNKPTDVLSFPTQNIEDLIFLATQAKKSLLVQQWPLGDIVISLDTATRQANEKKIPLRRELEVLLIHGFLHLLGYDHEISDKEERRMKLLERKLLTQIRKKVSIKK